MTPLEKKAHDFAQKAHDGQYRRDGMTPYFSHPYTVYLKVKGGEDENVVAFLHDVLEDTNVSEADLFKEGFSFEQVQAIKILTKKKGQSYSEYLKGVKQNKLAKAVKIADMLANLADDPTEKQIKKYSLGLVYLTDAF